MDDEANPARGHAAYSPNIAGVFRRSRWAVLVLAIGCASAGDSEHGELGSDELEVYAAGYRSGCGAPIRTGSYALLGDVVTPTGVIEGGYVVVDGEHIVEVGWSPYGGPFGIPAVDTHGVIVPGLVDGHNHVEYNHIPIADLGRRYGNRAQWPNAARYEELVKAPKRAVTEAKLTCQAIKHGEARALVGGTTAIQGTPQMACARPLVRNLEQTNFCQDRVKQNVLDIGSFGRSYSGRPSVADTIKNDIAADRLDAFVVHAGEGVDHYAHAEWEELESFGLALPETVMIHGTAFDAAQLARAGTAGSKIVWSPLSNLLLYGNTTNVPAAIDAGVLVSLGTDWAPSGSANLLGELKVADHVNQRLWSGALSDEQLVQMVTINPAIAYGLDAFIGSIEPGKVADLLVVRKRTGVSAYRSLIDARPDDVLLVTISGDPLYGEPLTMDALGKAGDYEVLDACGVPRAIDVTVVAKDVPYAGELLATAGDKLRAVQPRLTPVIDCTDDEAQLAYAGSILDASTTTTLGDN